MDEVILKISKSTLAALGQGLQELPYKIAAPAIAEIDRQLIEQAKAAHMPPAPVDSPKE